MKRAILSFEGTTLKRRLQPVLPHVVLDSGSAEPLYRQVYQFLRQAIATGSVAPGSPLPSTRTLASTLRVSRNTVLNAYESLTLEGWITGKVGSGTRARGQSRPAGIARPNLRLLLRESHYPADALPFRDPDGNLLHIHR
jgi:GntR family transcriptional regulator/MocR family aminotransferase